MRYIFYFYNYLVSFFYDIYFFFFGDVGSRISGLTYYRWSKLYPGYLKKGNMVDSAKWLFIPYCQGRGLDIGAGKWPFDGARSVEDEKEENAYQLKEEDNSQDFIVSSHNLEHLSDWRKALREWHRVLRPGGHICLYLPHPAVSMWRVKVNKQHLWTPDPLVIQTFLISELHMNINLIYSLPDGYLSFSIIANK